MRLRLLIPLAIFVTSPAFAADMIYEEPVPLPASPSTEPLPTYDWSGFHIGVDGGYGWGKFDNDDEVPIKLDAKGMFGGVFAGYDYQFDDWVLGIEGDIQYSKIDEELEGSHPAIGEYKYEYGLKRFGSARLRAGAATGRLLPYATGGLAFGKMELTESIKGATASFSQDYSKTLTGYTIGAGVDVALKKRLIGKLEYQYMDFGKFKASYGNADVGGEISADPFRMHTIRAGVGLKF